MTETKDSPPHITTTETVLRLYVLLAQYLDRCVDDAIRDSLSDKDFQRHLSETRTKVADLLADQSSGKRKGREGIRRRVETGGRLSQTLSREEHEKSGRKRTGSSACQIASAQRPASGFSVDITSLFRVFPAQ